jgi:hypothetical protein
VYFVFWVFANSWFCFSVVLYLVYTETIWDILLSVQRMFCYYLIFFNCHGLSCAWSILWLTMEKGKARSCSPQPVPCEHSAPTWWKRKGEGVGLTWPNPKWWSYTKVVMAGGGFYKEGAADWSSVVNGGGPGVMPTDTIACFMPLMVRTAAEESAATEAATTMTVTHKKD